MSARQAPPRDFQDTAPFVHCPSRDQQAGADPCAPRVASVPTYLTGLGMRFLTEVAWSKRRSPSRARVG